MPWKTLVPSAIALVVPCLGVAYTWGRLRRSDEIQDERLNKLRERVDKKMDREECEKEMMHGVNEFKEIKDDLKHLTDSVTAIGTGLARLDTAMMLLLDKNGIKKEHFYDSIRPYVSPGK